jgi:SulP family sulfate permease
LLIRFLFNPLSNSVAPGPGPEIFAGRIYKNFSREGYARSRRDRTVYIDLLKRFISDLQAEFSGYGPSGLTKDLMAGMTVAAVALPLALAFGVSSGADAAAGLITAIVAGLLVSPLGGAYYQLSGPTGAMAAILISITAEYQLQGVFIATFIAGVILLLCGVFRVGRLASFLPSSVIAGFTSGISIIIAFGQIDNLFGVKSAGESLIGRLLSYRALGFTPHWESVAVGAFVVAFMAFFPKRWQRHVPASLLGIIAATAGAITLGLDIPSIGEIPKTLFPAERLTLGMMDFQRVSALIPPAISIAMLGMIESLLCGASAGKMTGVRLNNDQELLAQGVGNLVIPFFGGVPLTAAIARTSVAVKSGAATRLTGVIHGLVLLAAMFLLAPLMSRIPLSALAGVLIVTAWRMNDWGFIKNIFAKRFKSPIVKFTATMVSTVVFDLTAAILIGVLLSFVLLIIRLSKLEVNFEKVDMSRIGCADPALADRYSNAVVSYITGPLIFSNAEAVEDIFEQAGDYDTFLMSMRGVSLIDISGAEAVADGVKALKRRGVDVIMCALPRSTMKMMERYGIRDLLGEQSFYWSVERALLDPRPRAGRHTEQKI